MRSKHTSHSTPQSPPQAPPRRRTPAIEKEVAKSLRQLDQYLGRSVHMQELDRDYDRAIESMHRRLRAP